MKKTLCWWIIGRDNGKRSPAIAIDVHDETGDLLGGTWTKTLVIDAATLRKLAELTVKEFAETAGITDVVFDQDSTDTFAKN